MTDRIWDLNLGDGPLVATAIHDGAEVRPEVLRHMAVGETERRHEEDPFTADWTGIASTRIVGLRSRFEVDLNRPREKAVYRTPEDCWGINLWSDGIPDDVAERSLAEYDAFYKSLYELYSLLAQRHGKFVVLDLHTYNHRRDGPNGPVANQAENPQVNLGTGTMNREKWAPVVERFARDLRSFDFPGGTLDVRENIKFQGGHHARWAHQTFPDSACVLAVEFKKFFMDEWTGEPDQALLGGIRDALASTVSGVLQELSRL